MKQVIGHRRVGTPGVLEAAAYLEEQAEAIRELAAQERPDLIVEVSLTGGM